MIEYLIIVAVMILGVLLTPVLSTWLHWVIKECRRIIK